MFRLQSWLFISPFVALFDCCLVFVFALSTSVVFFIVVFLFCFLFVFFLWFCPSFLCYSCLHIYRRILFLTHCTRWFIWYVLIRSCLMYLMVVWKQIISQSMVTQFLFSFVCRSYWLIYCLFSNWLLIASKNGVDFSLLCVPAFYFRVSIHLWRVKLAPLVLMDFLYGHTFPRRTNEIIFVLHWLGYSLSYFIIVWCVCRSSCYCQLLFKLFIISSENKSCCEIRNSWTEHFAFLIINALLERLHSTIV